MESNKKTGLEHVFEMEQLNYNSLGGVQMYSRLRMRSPGFSF